MDSPKSSKEKYCRHCQMNFCEDCDNKKCRTCVKPCNKYLIEQSISDVIESIALIETAMAHVLNAEGEKIQKAVCISENIDDLLEVNRSVNKTIINAIQLEQAYYQQLDTVNELYRMSCYQTHRHKNTAPCRKLESAICEPTSSHTCFPEFSYCEPEPCQPDPCESHQQEPSGCGPNPCESHQQEPTGCEPDPCESHQQKPSGCGPNPCESHQQEPTGCEPDPCESHQQKPSGCGPNPCESHQQESSGCGPDPCEPCRQEPSGREPDPCEPCRQEPSGCKPDPRKTRHIEYIYEASDRRQEKYPKGSYHEPDCCLYPESYSDVSVFSIVTGTSWICGTALKFSYDSCHAGSNAQRSGECNPWILLPTGKKYEIQFKIEIENMSSASVIINMRLCQENDILQSRDILVGTDTRQLKECDVFVWETPASHKMSTFSVWLLSGSNIRIISGKIIITEI